MTQDEIIELAKQAYLYSPCVVWTIEKSNTFVTTHEAVHDFAALIEAAARADERERIEKAWDKLYGWWESDDETKTRGTT